MIDHCCSELFLTITMPVVAMTSFFAKDDSTAGHAKVGSGKDLKKRSREHFWTGFLTLVANTLAAGPNFAVACT